MREDRQARTIKKIALAVVVLLIGGFVVSRLFNFAKGPQLTVETPRDYTFIREPLITVKGEVARVAKIHLNGREIFSNEQGIFEEKLLVTPGYSIMTITAEDQFNRSITRTIHLMRE